MTESQNDSDFKVIEPRKDRESRHILQMLTKISEILELKMWRIFDIADRQEGKDTSQEAFMEIWEKFIHPKLVREPGYDLEPLSDWINPPRWHEVRRMLIELRNCEWEHLRETIYRF